MDTSWWVSKEDLDPKQQDFINLPAHGRYLLEGSAGSGKTNLLLLRAQFVAGKGDKNVLIVTYTNALCDFIRGGLAQTGLFEADQVRTYHSWANSHIRRYLGQEMIPQGSEFDEAVRGSAVEMLREANKRLPTPKLYDAIFVDEAQDLTAAELELLLSLSDNFCVCGDLKQGIYHRDGLDISSKLDLLKFTLGRHYRIGQRIAQVADRLLPPAKPEESLEATSNYNVKLRGTPSAELHRFPSRDDQFLAMCILLRVQLDAFRGDKIGILCGKRDTASDLFGKFSGTDLESQVVYHNGEGLGFASAAPIHIMTMHSSKGAEFRAVHLYGIEELRHGYLRNNTLAYTAVTRAKTSLNAYCTGATSPELESAFAKPIHLDLDALFRKKNED